jgi:repressor LexA
MPSLKLTSTQQRVLDFITEWKDNQGYPPTVREIAEGLGFKSLNNVRQHLRLIEKKGFLKISGGKARGIEVMKTGLHTAGTGKVREAAFVQFGKVTHDNGFEVPLIGRVAAGTPIVAEENIEGTVTLDRTLFKGDGLFTLKVRGESMQDIGVFDGDIAVVKQQPGATNGEVVVAIVDGEATLKRFFKKEDKIVLHAENPGFSDIVVTSPKNVFIAGRLVGVIRKY